MTTGTSPDASADERRRAAKLLRVRDDAPPAEVRRAYLRKLRASDFLPPRPLSRAFRVLDGRPAAPDEEWLAAEESRLRDEVASFAGEFFALPVARRRERWESLTSQCQFLPPLAVRLQALKAGLDVESEAPPDSSRGGRLAGHLLHSFPLPPLARAASRQEFLRRVEEGADGGAQKLWEKADRRLTAERPAVAALDAELVRHVAGLCGRLKRRRRMHARSQRARRTVAAAGKKLNLWWAVAIVAGVILAAIRGSMNTGGPSSPSAPSSAYPSRINETPFRNPDPWRPTPDAKPAFSPLVTLPGTPPVSELLDDSKYDVELTESGAIRVFRFTPRAGPAPDGGRPVTVGEAMLRLLGAPGDQVDALAARAKKAPNRPQPAGGGEPRP